MLTVSANKNIGWVNVSTPVGSASEDMMEPISVAGETTDSAVNFNVSNYREMESCDRQPKINRNNVYILY